MRIISLLLLVFSLTSSLQTQTVGTIFNDPTSLQGYTFFSPFSGTKAWLVDNCGRLANVWERGTQPGLAAYFTETGHMLRTYKTNTVGPFTSASNAGGLELVDWDNNTVWHYELNTPTQLSHHDAVGMPNGNFLLLTWELVYTDELIELGRDPDEIFGGGYMWSERIIEVEPAGSDNVNILWEWRIKDHYIQDFDSTKLNFGVVAEHPELFNINLPELNSSNSNATRDWNHFNSIDYHPELDQILISVRNSDEIWILDHSTTTEEAATHTGGLYGKGGDILYRWGNASAYNRAPTSDQKLFGQHGVHWIKEGLNDAGKIMIFNNGNGRPGPDYSTVEILLPPQDGNGGYPQPETSPFGPGEPEWTYGHEPEEDFYSAYLSNAQRLPNGNTLINSGSTGTIFEIDENKNIVWEYVIPLFGDFPATQGQSVGQNSTFRAYRFAPDFIGFDGIDITIGETIESGTDPESCLTTVGTTDFITESLQIKTAYFPSERLLEVDAPEVHNANIVLTDVVGRTCFVDRKNEERQVFQLPELVAGVYVLQLVQAGKIVGREQLFLY